MQGAERYERFAPGQALMGPGGWHSQASRQSMEQGYCLVDCKATILRIQRYILRCFRNLNISLDLRFPLRYK